MTLEEQVKEILYQYDWEDNSKQEIIENSNVAKAICQLIEGEETCPEGKGRFKAIHKDMPLPEIVCPKCKGVGRILRLVSLPYKQEDIDIDIRDLVNALNIGGVLTASSCSGHNKENGHIWLKDGRVLIIIRPKGSDEEQKDIVASFVNYKSATPIKVRRLTDKELWFIADLQSSSLGHIGYLRLVENKVLDLCKKAIEEAGYKVEEEGE